MNLDEFYNLHTALYVFGLPLLIGLVLELAAAHWRRRNWSTASWRGTVPLGIVVLMLAGSALWAWAHAGYVT